MPQLSEEQKRALSETCSGSSVENSPRGGMVEPPDPQLQGGCRVVSEKEWLHLQKEVRRARYVHSQV